MESSLDTRVLRKNTRLLGLSYLSYTFLGFLNTFVVKPSANNFETLMNSVSMYRLAQIIDVFIFVFVIVASWAGYLVLKNVCKNLALLGFLFRFGEGLFGCVATAFCLMVVVVLKGNGSWSSFEPAQLNDMATMFMKLSSMMWNILFILMGIGAAIYMCLFLFSGYLPKWLSIWGLFSYLSMIMYGVAKILLANTPGQLMLIMFPGALFELTFGFWMLLKGVKA